jgi:hypothetical protein
MGVLPWGENDAFEACWKVYEAFREERGSGIDCEDLRILNEIHKAAQGESKRFARRNEDLNDVKRCLGRLVTNPDGEILFYDFTSTGLQGVCGCGIDRIIVALKPQGWLVPNDKQENQHRTNIKKKPWTFYRIPHDKVRDFDSPPDGEDAGSGRPPKADRGMRLGLPAAGQGRAAYRVQTW